MEKPTVRLQWKLKSSVGLVYDFPDLQALKNWLMTKDSVEGMLASKDGGVHWDIPSQHAELVDSLPRKLRKPRGTPPAIERSPTLGPTGTAPRMQALAITGLTDNHGSKTPPVTQDLSYGTSSGLSAPPRAVEAQPTVMLETGAGRPPTPRLSQAGTLRLADSSQDERISGAGERLRAQSARAAGSAVSGPTRSSPRSAASRPYPGVITGHHARVVAKKNRIGWPTRVGLLITLIILVAGALQVSGTFDFISTLGLRSTSGAGDPASPGASTRPDTAASGSSMTTGEIPVGPAGTPAGQYRPGVASSAGIDPRLQGMDRVSNPHQSRIDALLYQAQLASSEGRYEDAVAHVRTASQLDRTNAELYCLLAELNRQAGWYQEADAYEIQCSTLRGTIEVQPTAQPGPGAVGNEGDEPL